MVMHFPITFVIKTDKDKDVVLNEVRKYITIRANGMKVMEERYYKAIEEIITINELKEWLDDISDADVDRIIRDIDIFYRLEMNMELDY